MRRPTLAELIPRYVTPGGRYLGGGLLRPEVTDRAAFLREPAEATARVTDTELDVLLDDGGWRECKTAAWFIAAPAAPGSGTRSAPSSSPVKARMPEGRIASP
jgi:hypothetical protein